MGGKKKEKGKKGGVKPSLKIVIKEHKLLTTKYDDLSDRRIFQYFPKGLTHNFGQQIKLFISCLWVKMILK